MPTRRSGVKSNSSVDNMLPRRIHDSANPLHRPVSWADLDARSPLSVGQMPGDRSGQGRGRFLRATVGRPPLVTGANLDPPGTRDRRAPGVQRSVVAPVLPRCGIRLRRHDQGLRDGGGEGTRRWGRVASARRHDRESAQNQCGPRECRCHLLASTQQDTNSAPQAHIRRSRDSCGFLDAWRRHRGVQATWLVPAAHVPGEVGKIVPRRGQPHVRTAAGGHRARCTFSALPVSRQVQ